NRSHADKLLAEQIQDPVIRSFLLQNLYAGEQGYQWRLNLRGILENISALMDFPFEKETPPFGGSALCIAGGNSEYFEETDKELFREFFPKVRMVTIKGAGHWVHADSSAIFFESVSNFLFSLE
ncbi:MAG: alpha/beta hydrolase, partial [Alphaproteobacteria bacterium]